MAATTNGVAPAALLLPQELRAQGFSLRPESDDDLPFLARLYASTREQEMALVPWTPEQKQRFLLDQFDAQRRHYRLYFEHCAFGVLERRGAPIGRLYLERRGRTLHIVDLALMPEWRGQGLGGQILKGVFASARAEGLGVGICVEKFNPAQRLYRRLGFRELSDDGVYLHMERPPEPVSSP